RASVAILTDEDTLSRGLGTPPLPEARSPVGYCWQNSRCRRPLRGRSTATSTTSCRTSGKGVLSPAPPPLRTVRAPFDAYGSSMDQRPCEIRPGRFHRPTTSLTGRGCPIGLGVHLVVTAPVPATEMDVTVAGAAPAR